MRSWPVRLALLCALAAPALDCLAQQCKPIDQLDKHATRTGYVRGPGRHCLDRDIVQQRVFDVHAGQYKSLAGVPLIEIDGANGRAGQAPDPAPTAVDVDLNGHLLKGEADELRGIMGSRSTPRIKVGNGRIDVPGTRSPNVGIHFDHPFAVNTKWARRIDDTGDLGPGIAVEWIKLKEDMTPAEAALGLTWPIASPELPLLDYATTQHTVERIDVHAGWRGVVMGGAGNILRNSTIDVDGHTAIYMYGPGSIIENNTIVVHGRGDAGPFDAAIKLRDARGAVVRNNRIIYKGGWLGKAPAAIHLLVSTDVTIEGNTVERFNGLVRTNGQSKYTEKNNVAK